MKPLRLFSSMLLLLAHVCGSTVVIAEVVIAEKAAAKSVASCSSPEPWGESRYQAGQTDGINYYVKAFSQPARLARVIATPGPVALCSVLGSALIFVVPDQGVFQVDRRIDGDGAPFWLAPVPGHFSSSTRFEQSAATLKLVTGHFTSTIETEDEVRNDVVLELAPAREVSLPVAIEPPLVLDNSAVVWPAGGTFYRFSGEELVPMPAPGLQLKQVQTLPTGLQVAGFCAADAELVVFDGAGQVLRMRQQSAQSDYEILGRFQLDSAVQACQVDGHRQRLYIVNQTPMLWVFDLQTAGLTAPRSVTSDLIVNALTGIALYGSDYVMTQSSGDNAILLFTAEQMSLVKRFRIGADVARGMDGVSQSGGLAAAVRSLPGFPRGALLVHDAINRLPEAPANIKVIDWRAINP